MAEGTHWSPHVLSMYDVGWRCVATNVSDLAAMGSTPQVLLVTAVLGPAMSLDDLDAFIDGLADGCRAHEVKVAGGDVVRGDGRADHAFDDDELLVVTPLAVFGSRAGSDRVVLRSIHPGIDFDTVQEAPLTAAR